METDRWTLDGINEINVVTKGIPGTTETREEMSPLGCLRRLLRGWIIRVSPEGRTELSGYIKLGWGELGWKPQHRIHRDRDGR